MPIKPRPCATCRTETVPATADPISGEAKALVVTLRGLPLLACRNGHRQFVHREFPLQLLERLVEEDEATLPAGEEKGVLFKHFYCTACGAELAAKPDHRHTFTVDVALPDLVPFQVDLSMPVYKCTACAREQLHSLKEIRERTPAALAHAFQGASIPHA